MNSMFKCSLVLLILASASLQAQSKSILNVLDKREGQAGISEIRLLLSNDINAGLKKAVKIGDMEFAQGMSSIVIASYFEYTDLVKALIRDKADVDANNSTSGRTALMFSIFKENKDIVKMLLAAKANPSLQNKLGYGPLGIAIYNNNIDIVNMLIKARVNVNLPEQGGNTPLIIASKDGQEEIVKILIKAKADINIRNNRDESALDLAQTESIKNLLLAIAPK